MFTLTRVALAIIIWFGSVPVRAQTAPAVPAKPAALDSAALERKVDELMIAHVKVHDFGGAVLLARDGKPLVSKGYGFANHEWQIPATAETKFRIGSITKPFTATLIMQLREQGKVRVEDSICVYLAPCPDAWKPVTIHHRLTHTSGIRTYTAIPAWRETNMVPKTVDQMVALFRDLPLQWTARREVRLQQLRLLPAWRDHRDDHRQEVRGSAAGVDPRA